MYSYTYDEETGGILLNSTPTVFSKEPRPVYAAELDMLGFSKYWKYNKQSDIPYMWAESVQYWYRGRQVAKLKGGDLYEAPEIILPTDEQGNVIMPEPDESPLRPVDIEGMVEKNRDMLDIIENTTVKKIVAIYEKYKNKLDIFHVAFSGGKDSAVLLNLVKRALPKKSFVVVFGDTGMEFPDTYDAVENERNACEQDEIPFYIARSHFDPHDSWKIFGPPARVLRWCCSVHKSTPQTLKLREITGKNDYVGMDFVGVRKHESVARSEYKYENYGKKQKGQYSFNAILEWTSAEVWLYIFAKGIYVNKAYKKGNTRAGCLLCPMSTSRSMFVSHFCYPDQVDALADIITKTVDSGNKKTYLTNGGFNSRRSGRDLVDNETKYIEVIKRDRRKITIFNPSSNWNEWKKTISDIEIKYEEDMKDGEISVIIDEKDNGTAATKYLKQALKKSAYCVGCKVCEANCIFDAIEFDKDGVHIDSLKCKQCKNCHSIPNGCFVAESRKKLAGEKKMKSLNCFDSHAPKDEWVRDFWNDMDRFVEENSLGPNQMKAFKRFLNDSTLYDTRKKSKGMIGNILSAYTYEDDSVWGLILVEMTYNNPQINWYVSHMDIGRNYNREDIEIMLEESGTTKNDRNFIISAFRRFCELPMGVMYDWGTYELNGRQVKMLSRRKFKISDNRVVLYSLYTFAEKCNNYKEFTLSWMMNDDIDRDGISPTRLFGLEYEEMKSILMGLTAKYPEFINATFTNDLDKISLTDKTPEDVLRLFEEE